MTERRGLPPDSVRMIPAPPSVATNLVLIRHGESACSRAGVVGGHQGCTGLTDTGVLEATALRERLLETGELAAASAMYSSVLERAVQTATILSPAVGSGLDPVPDCSLCELHPGEADGLTWTEFKERYGEPDFVSDPDIELSPGGESWTSFVERASRALREVAARHEDQTVAVVCHGGVIEASLLAFLPLERDMRRLRLRTEHTSLTEWELSDDGWKLLRYNDAAHLAGRRRAGSPGARAGGGSSLRTSYAEARRS